MAVRPTQEGHIPFVVPSLDTPCETHYKVFGNLQQSERTPLVVLHGGPGSGHEYLLAFTKLWTEHGVPLVFYDQIGCAGSTHLRHKAGDHSFWQVDLFVSELENVLQHLHLGGGGGAAFDILGHSFGGMVATVFAARQPAGLRRLILSGTPAGMRAFGEDAREQLKQLSAEAQKGIDEAMRDDDYTGQPYQHAMAEWSRTFWSRADPWPGEVLKVNLQHQATDKTARSSM